MGQQRSAIIFTTNFLDNSMIAFFFRNYLHLLALGKAATHLPIWVLRGNPLIREINFALLCD
jgi:hypothetical protein